MTIREIIQILQRDGHVVSYYERKDGGILIRSIDGVRYSGAQGNTIARAMTGQPLSEKRSSQLSRAQAKRTTGSISLDKLARRVQRKWNKAFKKGTKSRKKVGDVKMRQVRWRAENLSEEDAIKSLLEKEKYAEGYAYTENVNQLVGEINKLAKIHHSSELEYLARDIKNNANMIREEWIYPIYEELYKIDKGFGDIKRIIKDVVQNIRRITNLI